MAAYECSTLLAMIRMRIVMASSPAPMNPNHYSAVAVWYLFQNRPGWPRRRGQDARFQFDDRPRRCVHRAISEVPVGFAVRRRLAGRFAGFGGEESAGLPAHGWVGATTRQGRTHLNLLAARSAKTWEGRDPGEHYADLEARFGRSYYRRADAAANDEQKAALANLSPEMVTATEMAGEPITAKLTHAPGNGAAIGGLKVVTPSGWFAARPSGTESIYKIYAESFKGENHLAQIQSEAQTIVQAAFAAAGLHGS